MSTLQIENINALPKELELPDEIYSSDEALAQYIVEINERLSKVSQVEKLYKTAKEKAEQLMLNRIESSGQKHFAFEKWGTFSPRISVNYSFPNAENGGKEAVISWLDTLIANGLADKSIYLDVQQARVSKEPVVALIEAVAEYNENKPDDMKLPESPFTEFVQQKLSSPQKRKAL